MSFIVDIKILNLKAQIAKQQLKFQNKSKNYIKILNFEM